MATKSYSCYRWMNCDCYYLSCMRGAMWDVVINAYNLGQHDLDININCFIYNITSSQLFAAVDSQFRRFTIHNFLKLVQHEAWTI